MADSSLFTATPRPLWSIDAYWHIYLTSPSAVSFVQRCISIFHIFDHFIKTKSNLQFDFSKSKREGNLIKIRLRDDEVYEFNFSKSVEKNNIHFNLF